MMLWNTRRGLSYNAGAWAKFERPKKRLRFLRPLKFGRARMTEQGLRPAALFAVRVVFEAVALICGNRSDACDLYPQKARSSCGRDPRSRRQAGGDAAPTRVLCDGACCCLRCRYVLLNEKSLVASCL